MSRRFGGTISRTFCLVLMGLLSLTGCAVQRPPTLLKDGKVYCMTPDLTWRGRWWDYYQRGLSCVEGEFWAEAMADFQAAIAQRAADQRYARSYGLRFFTDYFPHRDLGIIYYVLHRYPEAIRELETSLYSADSAKAKFYLNKARREWLRQTGRDVAAPRLVLDSPQDDLWTNRRSITVAGQAEDDTYVAAVDVQGQRLFIELAEPRLDFRRDVQLVEGTNVIDVLAEDLLGGQTRQRLTIHLDRQSPLLTLEGVVVRTLPAPQQVTVTGLVADASPIKRFVMAGRPLATPSEREWTFQEVFTVQTEVATLAFEIEDAAGNVVRGEIALAAPPPAPADIREGQWVPATPWPRWATLQPGLVLADLADATLIPPQRLVQEPPEPPMIRLTAPEPQTTVYTDDLYLGGEITASRPIVALTVHGAAPESEVFRWRRQSRRLFFGALVPLQIGENRLLVDVQDELGHVTRREVVVQRVVQPARQLAARLAIAVLPLRTVGAAYPLGTTVYEHLLAAFVQQKRFRLLERQHLEDILREQGVRQRPRMDPATALKVGKLVAAEGTVSGEIIQKSSQALEVIADFIDVETREQMTAADVYGEDLTPHDVKALMHGLAWKFQQHLPLVEGLVLDCQGRRLLVDRGRQHAALKPFMKMLLYRATETTPHTRPQASSGEPTGQLGEARLAEVLDRVSKADLLRAACSSAVWQAAHFITK